MAYTTVPSQVKLELNSIKKSFESNPDSKECLAACIANPTVNSHYMLGLTPYSYQHLILRRYRDNPLIPLRNDRIIVVKPRQVGISICLGPMLAVWYAAYNKANNGKGTSIHNNTKVGIISRDDRASKKLMGEIKNIVLNSKMKSLVKQDRHTPFNTQEFHFQKGWIKCFPPTDASRGESFDLAIVDEAGFVDDDVYYDAIEPTVSAVGGKIILSSTANGQKGFFFETFDPFNNRKKHEFYSYWFHWKMCENSVQKKIISQKFKWAKETGNLKHFNQEYNALFTVDQSAFFEDNDVNKAIDSSLSVQYDWKGPCSVGIDYGITNCATVISVVAKVKKKIVLLFEFAKNGLDLNKLTDKDWEHSVPNLMKRYPGIQNVVVDDCTVGHQTNQKLINDGFPVMLFNFRSDQVKGERNRGYYAFRSALHDDVNNPGVVKFPSSCRGLISEMKALQEESLSAITRIKAPPGYHDDRIDSFMMACYPFVTTDGGFESELIDYEKIKKKVLKDVNNPRRDKQWVELQCKGTNAYDFLLEKRGRPKLNRGLE